MKEQRKKKERKPKDADIADLKATFILKRLYRYVGKGHRNFLIFLACFIIGNIIFSFLNPLVFRALIDDGLGGGLGVSSGNINVIYFLGTLFFVFTVCGVFMKVGQNYVISRLVTMTMYNLRAELFDKFQRLGLDYHESPKRSTGRKISYMSNDVDTLQELLSSGLLTVIGNVFLIFGALTLMIILSPQLTLVAFLLVPIVFGIGGSVFKKARRYFRELRERVATVTSELDESINGMRIIQSFAVEEENYKEFIDATEKEKETTLKSAKLLAFIPGMMTMTITICLGALFFTAGLLIREGSITVGTLVAFIFYMFLFFEPLIQMVGFFTLLQNSIAAGGRIVRLLDEKPTVKEKSDAIELKEVKGKIEFNNVNFEYEKDVPILNEINIQIKEKERLALVGYTGAGKSTFIKLLTRFYDPTKGEITIDGINLKDIKIKSLVNKMGVVQQENYLFSGTILDNIKYGKLDATEEEVFDAAKKVNAHEFILKLEKGYQTEVGERGSRLSEGQRQLISFARALIANPPILILDEATSSVDPYSEMLIQQALETLLKGRTSVSIAHRLSTIINSDRIVVLDKGRIIEQGSHQELVKKAGFYKHLYDMQFKDPFKKEQAEVKDEDLENLRKRELTEKEDRLRRYR